MGVYIKGMEMPKPKLADMATVYDAYILVSPNGHTAIVVDNEDGLDSTEYLLVPIPPHGRLINADAVIAKLNETSKRIFGGDDIPECSSLSIVEDYIEDAPTIIPTD